VGEPVVPARARAERADREDELVLPGVDFERHLVSVRRSEGAQYGELEVVHSLVGKVEPGSHTSEDEGRDAAKRLVRRNRQDDSVAHEGFPWARVERLERDRLHSEAVAMSDEFDVTVETAPDGALVMRVTGDLDLATSPRFEDTLSSAPAASHVVIDLTGCTFLDSSGVRVLVQAARNIPEGRRRVDLVTANAGILRVLEITGVDRMMPVHPSLEQAL